MRIVLANYRYYVTGGPEMYMFNVKRLLEDNGHEVIPFTVRSNRNVPSFYESYYPHGKNDSGEAYYANVKKTPGNIARMLSCSFYNREAYDNLRRLIRELRPDAIYVLQQINALSPSIFKAAHDEGVRVVHRLSDFNMMCPRSDFLCNSTVCTACIHGDYSKALKNRCCHGSRTTTLVRTMSMKFHALLKLFGYVDAFICPTQFTANMLREHGIPLEKISVIPTFVDLNASEINRDKSDKYVVYLGRISPEKGIDHLIRAAAMMPALRVKITGNADSEYGQSMKKLAMSLGVSSRVDFVGFVDGEDKRRLISGAAVLVCPSIWYENMPNSILEAFSYRVPVIAFDIGCMPNLVKENNAGIIVPLGDECQLSEAIERIYSNPDLGKTMGASGFYACETKYSKEEHYKKLIKVLHG